VYILGFLYGNKVEMIELGIEDEEIRTRLWAIGDDLRITILLRESISVIFISYISLQTWFPFIDSKSIF
jgi:hypothetical protein